MKKLKLDLNDLKVESFETTQASKKIGTVQGQAMLQDTNPDEPCGGGGGGIGTNTWCFGEACDSQDYMYTCQDSCPDCGGGGGYENTNYYSCPCTDPAYDPACSTWYPSQTCPPW